MCFRLFFCLFCFFLILAVFTQGCLKMQEKTYTMIPADVHKEAEKICKNIDGSHYIVRDRRVWLKKKDEGEIELNHYKTILRDGYYFCSGHDRSSTIID